MHSSTQVRRARGGGRKGASRGESGAHGLAEALQCGCAGAQFVFFDAFKEGLDDSGAGRMSRGARAQGSTVVRVRARVSKIHILRSELEGSGTRVEDSGRAASRIHNRAENARSSTR